MSKCHIVGNRMSMLIFLSLSALCILIEWAVFVDNTNTSSSNVGYSGGFALTIIAFILALVAGVIGVIDWVMKGSSS